MRILFIGDIVGKPGRQAVTKALPDLKKEFQPDVVIANAENIAHGIGITAESLAEVQAAGVELFTSGNHVFRKKGVEDLLTQSAFNLIRPANFPPGNPGVGSRLFTVGDQKLLLVNVIGRVYAREQYDDPFRAMDLILAQQAAGADAIFVDFHGDATSEKRAFGLEYDGKVSVIVGTHTHVPTADAQVMQKGTAYITDVGMVGSIPSVIGVKPAEVINQFRMQVGGGLVIEEDTQDAELGAVLVEVTGPTRATSISHIRRIVRLS